MRKALKRRKNGQAGGSDHGLVEEWKFIEEKAVKLLTKLYNMILDSDNMSGEWWKRILVPIFDKVVAATEG